jgi:hypothetical protein
MKPRSVIFAIAIAVLPFCAGVVSAQTDTQAGATAEMYVHDGGLGRGLSNMVKGILGETEAPQARYAAPAEPSVMMQMTALDSNASVTAAPQAATMSLKAANAETTIVPMSDSELSAYVHDLLIADSNIQSIDTSDTHVRVTYAVPSTVFRFVKVVLRVTVSANASGLADVSYPWYSFAASHAATDLRTDVSERVAPLIPGHAFSPDEQRMLIDEIHLTLAARLGSSTGGDR